MASLIGFYSLIFGLCCSFLIILFSVKNFKHKNAFDNKLISLTFLQLFFVILSFLGLILSFVNSDFSNETVFNHSHTTKPLFYKISGTWGNHEGSLLLWLLVLTLFIFIFLLKSKEQKKQYRILTLLFQQIIIIGFFIFVLKTSNPFNYIFPVPNEGLGLNPILQDPALAIHPPILYLGYVGSSIIFSSTLAAMMLNQISKDWAKHIKKWVLGSWIFLTLGILLGSIWAYYELGWGGWWFWDPVENASFMPWLTGTALIHSLAVTEKRHALRNWTVLLAIICFSLSLLGTFLVRSGVITSVHAFASDPTRGVFILAFLGLVVGISLSLFAFRAWQLRTLTPFSLISREMALLSNSVLLLIIMLTVLLGTLYPLMLEALGGGKISVGSPYFSLVFIPLMIPVVILVGIGSVSRWREDTISNLSKQLRTPAILAVVFASVSLLFLPGKVSFTAWFALLLAFWVINSLFTQLKKRLRHSKNLLQDLKRTPRGWYGMILAHMGLSFTVIGIGLSSVYSQEQDVHMLKGDDRTLGEYRFELVDVEKITGPNYKADMGTIRIYKNEKELMTLHPEKRIYNVRKNVMTEASIHSNLLRDLYVSLGEQRDINTGAWSVRLYYKPFILWIWLGGFVMVLGGSLALTDKRYRTSLKQEEIKLDDNNVLAN